MKRIHIHVFVKDLQENIHFYSTLFGSQPGLREPSYAQWKLDNPPVNFAISQNAEKQGIHHLGIDMDSPASLQHATNHFSQAEIEAPVQNNAECCYARSDKIWPTDPQGILWELFYSHEKSRSLSLGDIDYSQQASVGQQQILSCCSDPQCECNSQSLAQCCVN